MKLVRQNQFMIMRASMYINLLDERCVDDTFSIYFCTETCGYRLREVVVAMISSNSSPSA